MTGPWLELFWFIRRACSLSVLNIWLSLDASPAARRPVDVHIVKVLTPFAFACVLALGFGVSVVNSVDTFTKLGKKVRIVVESY